MSLAPFVRIFCEGEVTERLYLKGFVKECRLVDADPQQPNDFSPMGLVEAGIKAQKEAQKNGYKAQEVHIWVVMDKDQHPRIAEAIALAQKNKIRVAFSNLCFEYWLLLHFQYTTAADNSAEDVLKRLEKQVPEYNKSNKFDIYERFRPLLEKACENARKVRSAQSEVCDDMEHFWEIAPYTNLDELVEHLFELRQL